MKVSCKYVLTICAVLASVFFMPSLHAWQKSIRFDRINIDQGLPDNYVRSIVQDSHGFMWFGTANGLAKYDGYRFTVYQHDIENPDSISSNEILYVFEDSQKTLWVGTDAGLNRFNREQETFSHFRHDPENPSSLGGEVVAKIYEDRDGILWIGHWFSGLSRFDRTNETFEQFHHDPEKPESLPPGVVFAILEDRSGVFWVGTYAREGLPDLTRFDRETRTFSRFFTCSAEQPQCPQPVTESDRPPISQVITIFEDREDNIWVGGFGLIKYDRGSNTYKLYLHDPENSNSPAGNKLAGMVEDSNGLLWFGDTFQSLTSFDPETETFNRYRHDPADPHSISDDNLFTLYQDRGGIIWVASYDNGLSKFAPHSLALGHYKHDPNDTNSLSSNLVQDIAEDENGILWVAAGGLNRIDRSNGIVTLYQHDPDDPASLHDNDVRALHVARSGLLWIGTVFGLSRFDPETESFEYFPVDPGATEPSDVGVLSIAEDRDGFLWLGTNSTVSRFDTTTGHLTHYRANPDHPDALHGDTFGIEMIADDGTIWIESSTGINLFNPGTEVFTHYVHDPGNPDSLAQGPVHEIWQDQQGVIWVGTMSGLGHLDPESGVFRRYTGNGNFPKGRINGILSDGRGSLWISTHSEGLWKLNPVTGDFRTYDVSDGLTSAPLDRGLLSQNGEVIFSSDNGIHIFNPDVLPDHQQDPVVVFTDFLLLNKSVPVSNAERKTSLSKHINETPDITLSYKDYLFEFEFAALNYVDPMAMRYAYMLEGFDEDWIETDASKRFATYTNVPQGDYVLRVKASEINGEWGNNNASIRLGVLPPFWLTWWAYGLYFIVAVLALFLYIRFRTISLTRRATLLENTVQERTAKIREHELHIQHQAEDLEELLHMKEKLVANISHEFRTPLTLILGPARRVLQKTANPETRSQLQMIRRNGQRLLRLVDQLLGFARLGAEEPLVRSAQSITSVADAITESFRVLAEEKDLQLTYEQSDELWVSCAPDTLEKILLNLISNAIKYTPAGGRITVSITLNDDDMVELSVTDTGVGIPEQDQKVVFERFHRLGDSGETIPGAGIGLALVKELVEAQDGRIQLLSTPGEGTTVSICLPQCEAVPGAKETELASVSAEAIALETEAIIQSHSAREPLVVADDMDGKPCVLVIEDNLDMQNYLIQLLSDTYHCEVASDGRQALDTAFEHIPDLVLCDVMLPKLDGFQVSHALKEDERTSHIPIILLTARSDRDSRLVGWKEKVDGYLTKPFHDEELKLRIANLLDIRDILKSRFKSHFFEETEPGQVLNEKENGFMEKLEQVLEQRHVDPEFGLSQMASEMFMSPRQLQRKLKAISGHHPAEFLRSYRLRNARKFLKSGTQVGLAADAVGFSSPAYFTSCFKAQFSLTPSEYQQRFY